MQRFYSGFFIEDPVGNNAFSFTERRNRRIFVPPLITGSLSDLKIGETIVFSEIESGQEHNLPGLDQFIFWQRNHQPIFIFDNHNHAFCFWIAAYRAGVFPAGLRLVHVDQHSDMREPAVFPNSLDEMTIPAAFEYTNFQLNVGNFIQPALRLGLFKSVEIIDSSYSLSRRFDEPIVLDIDVDFFADAMSYIRDSEKLAVIRSYLNIAQFVTIATSPYFISQQHAIDVIHNIFRQ